MDRFDWLELADITRPDEHSAAPAQAPVDGPSYYRAARRMRQSGHYKAAADFYENAIGFDEQNYGAWTELIDTLVRAGHLDEAEAWSKEALDKYRQVRLFYASRALVLAHRGQHTRALELSDISLEENTLWYPRALRAEVLLVTSCSFRDEALTLLKTAQQSADTHWEPAFIAGSILLDAQLPVLAAAFFSEAVHADTQAVIGWLCLGDCFRALRLYDQALFYYQKATEVEPTHELALERQKRCTPLLFGLTKAFDRRTLRQRWSSEYDKLKEHWEPGVDDF
jgi:tetratricopeptide (TPR) repeat protein